MKSALLALSLFMGASFSLFSEIEKVVITWTPGLCNPQCGKQLEKQFRSMNSLSNVSIDLGGNKATLLWKKNSPFSYTNIYAQMAYVGISYQDIYLTVKGKIKHTGNKKFFITSDTDNTVFQLLGFATAGTNQYVEMDNVVNRGLSASQIQQLLDGETKQLTATIQGPLYQPETSPPLRLVIGNLNFGNSENKPQVLNKTKGKK